MEKILLTPKETIDYTESVGIKKTENTTKHTILAAILAGFYIALGGLGYSKVLNIMTGDPLGVIIGSITFSVGLMLVLIGGAELFTGNILLLVAHNRRKITTSRMLRNWIIVWIFNLIGACIMAALAYYALEDPELMEKIANISLAKTNHSFMHSLASGVLCNIVVCLAVLMSYTAKDGVSKIIISSFLIYVFVLLGFQHSVANMFYHAIGVISGEVLLGAVISNLIPVTIGNIIGGSAVALIYSAIYK